MHEVRWLLCLNPKVAKVLKNPDLILRGISHLNEHDSNQDLDQEIANAEKGLRTIQGEEDRAVRLFITAKISEEQLDRQRRFITERLEHVRSTLSNLRSQRQSSQDREALTVRINDWVSKVEVGMDALDPETRQEILRLVVDTVVIGRENDVRITLAIPMPDVVSNDFQEP